MLNYVKFRGKNVISDDLKNSNPDNEHFQGVVAELEGNEHPQQQSQLIKFLISRETVE